MARRRVRFADAVENRPGCLFLRFSWRTLPRHVQPPLTIVRNGADAIAAPDGSQTNPKQDTPRLFEVKPESHLFSCFDYFWGGLGFTATRRLRKDSQRVGGLSTAALLELVDPVRYRINHIARRLACRISLSLG